MKHKEQEHGIRINSTCTFAAQRSFKEFEECLASKRNCTLSKEIVRTNESKNEDQCRFVTSIRLQRNDELRILAAKKNEASKVPYEPPSEYQYRENFQHKWKNGDFECNFHLENNQNLRLRTALDQEGFFDQEHVQKLGAKYMQQISTKPFQTRVPHTTSKHANLDFRRKTILDQEGLLPDLQQIRQHKFRDEASPSTPFKTNFRST